MKNLEKLTPQEKEMLFMFPAYISLLAINRNGKPDKTELEEAIRFSHVKTFSSDPLLYDFYKEADRVFADNLSRLDKSLPAEKEERETAIKKELAKLEPILHKLGNAYSVILRKSMKSFKDHVSRAHHSILESLVFPVPIKGLTD